MKTSRFNWLLIAGSIILMTGFTADDVLAQRPSRGGSGTTAGGSNGSSGSRPTRPPSSGSRPPGGGISRPPVNGGSRPDYKPGQRPSRPNAGYRPNYHYRPGLSYHRPYYGYYNYYRPFIGVRLSVLPFGYYPFYYGPDQFYYSGGFFYRQYDNGYKVVVPPVGAQVPSIPAEAKEISINGQVYYEYKGVYYSSTVDANGKTVYVVAGKDGVLDTMATAETENNNNLPKEGDTFTELPANVRDVIIKGTQYYVSEDGVYYEKLMDGDKVTYKVVGVGN